MGQQGGETHMTVCSGSGPARRSGRSLEAERAVPAEHTDEDGQNYNSWNEEM